MNYNNYVHHDMVNPNQQSFIDSNVYKYNPNNIVCVRNGITINELIIDFDESISNKNVVVDTNNYEYDNLPKINVCGYSGSPLYCRH